MIEYIREIDSIDQNGELNNIAGYCKVPGVWILLGKKRGQADAPVECLQVAQTKDIGGEIKRDVGFLGNKRSVPVSERDKLEKWYVNQFGECMFRYKSCPNRFYRAESLYKEIAEKYEGLVFVCVAHGDALKDNKLRKNIEKYVAYRTLSLYWVNGRPYKNKKDAEEIRLIKESCKKESAGIFEKIKSSYGKKADFLDQFLDDLLNGKTDIQVQDSQM